MFSFFTHINQERQKMEQSRKEMELRHNEFADIYLVLEINSNRSY